MEDNSLLKEFIDATGLPLEIAVRIVAELMVEEKVDPQTITVEDLRNITAAYLRNAFEDVST